MTRATRGNALFFTTLTNTNGSTGVSRASENHHGCFRSKTFTVTLVCAQLDDCDQLLRKLTHKCIKVVLIQHSVVHTIGRKDLVSQGRMLKCGPFQFSL